MSYTINKIGIGDDKPIPLYRAPATHAADVSERPRCNVRGVLGRGLMCAHVMVGGQFCCRPAVPCAHRQEQA